MANLNPLQNLQSRDSILYANQTAVDLPQRQSDQSLTSFPDELNTAKQQVQSPSSDTLQADARAAQSSEQSPQNLPPSPDQSQQDAANIAAPQLNLGADMSVADTQDQADSTLAQGVDPATLGQVAVALAVEARSSAITEALVTDDVSLVAGVLNGTDGKAVLGNGSTDTTTLQADAALDQTQSVVEVSINPAQKNSKAVPGAAAKAALTKATADAAALQAGTVLDQTQAVVEISIDPGITDTTQVSLVGDALHEQAVKEKTGDSITGDAQAVVANQIAVANVVQLVLPSAPQTSEVVIGVKQSTASEDTHASTASLNAIAAQLGTSDAAANATSQAVSAGDSQTFSSSLNQAAASVAAATALTKVGPPALETAKTNPGKAVDLSTTVTAQAQANTEQVATSTQTSAAQNLLVDQVVIQKIELPTTVQSTINVAVSPAVQSAVQSVINNADDNVIDQAALASTAVAVNKPADQAIAQATPKSVNLPKVEKSSFTNQVRSQNTENFVATSVAAKQERSSRVVAKDESVGQASTNGISATDVKQTSFIGNLNNEAKLTQNSTLKLEPHNASLATGPLNSEVMRVLKEGGGRVVMEVTPPDQGTIRIDLRLDNQGSAIVVVDGASDSTRARLEQGSAQLKEQLAQMGLSLSLDMRQQSNNAGQSQFMAEGVAFGNSNNSSGVAANADIAAGILGTATPAADGRINLYA